MKNHNKIGSTLKVILVILALIFITSGCEKTFTNLITEETVSSDPNRYLDAVREFADNVLEYGRDTYGPEHTPLFVDGLMVRDPNDPNYGEDGVFKPVEWIDPDGERWILSNFASQQTLLRTLDGLSTVTGDPKYKQAAMEAIEYAFENLRSPNGLLYWGHRNAYDALGDTVCGNTRLHEFKSHYPYYELMWEVDPEATCGLIEAIWSAHILDWSNLDMNRIANTLEYLEKPWEYEYDEEGPTFFQSKVPGAHGFFVTGTSLAQAGTTLYRLSSQEQPLVWSKRMIKRFVDTRHPNTGISTGLYNKLPPRSPLGDDLREHYADYRTDIFPIMPFEETRGLYYPENIQAYTWMSLFLVGDSLGEKGREFTQWALEELTAWGKASYRKKDNSFVPIITDGTNIEGYVSKDNPKGAIAKPFFADPSIFWAYAVAYRTTSDEFMWQMCRDISLGNDLGDIGATTTDVPKLKTDTTCSDVYGLLGFLELYGKTSSPSFLQMARCIGDNILAQQFHEGFFVPSKEHIYTRFDCFEPLALLHLATAIDSKSGSVPQVWSSWPLFTSPFRYKEEGVDRRIIYTLTDSPEPPLSLQEGAAIGDVNLVSTLIENGTGIDSLDDSYLKTALHHASMSGHTEVVELLIVHGADVNARDDSSFTPLHYATQRGHVGIVELLIDNGADINAENDRGLTSGDIALRLNRTEIVELLQSQGVDISSIHEAAQMGNLARVESFLEGGIDVNAKDENGQTALHIAVSNNHEDIVELLMDQGADVNTTDQSNYTPLYYAIFNINKNIVSLLVDKGADVNLTPEEDYTPLHYAVSLEDLDIVKLLVDKGAKFDVKVLDDWTAFRNAAAGGRRDMVELFISKGVDTSGLHIAAFIGDLSRVKALVEQGTDVDTEDEAGWTALFWAACSGQTEVAEFLIDNNADISANDGRGSSLLHQAAIVPTVDVKFVELLISNGIGVDVKDNRGNTPLHTASLGGNREAAGLLIDSGADINMQNNAGWTPLYYACLSNDWDVSDLLITKGADINMQYRNGLTLLHLAVQSGQKDMVEFLLAKGADASIVNNRGLIPLDLATRRGRTEIVELLREYQAKE